MLVLYQVPAVEIDYVGDRLPNMFTYATRDSFHESDNTTTQSTILP